MINRCKECGNICPDFSEVCDCCKFIEEEEKIEDDKDYLREVGDKDD